MLNSPRFMKSKTKAKSFSAMPMCKMDIKPMQIEAALIIKPNTLEEELVFSLTIAEKPEKNVS